MYLRYCPLDKSGGSRLKKTPLDCTYSKQQRILYNHDSDSASGSGSTEPIEPEAVGLRRKSGGTLFDWPEAWPWSPSYAVGPAAAPASSPARGGAPPAARVADQDPCPDPESGSGSRRPKITHKSRNFFFKFMFWSVGWPLLRAEGFFRNLNVLYGGQGIAKL